jgi:AcrR family transcriptional regulator
MAEPGSLRERARQAVREQLIDRAMDLFATNGYESTTVAQVARAVGISERSLFRYFGSKEELVLASHDQSGRDLADRLGARPESEPVWLALRRAFDPIVAATDNPHGRASRLIDILHHTPELHRAQLSRRHDWAMLLVPHVARRIGLPEADIVRDPRAAAIAAAAIMAYQSAQTTWMNAKGTIRMNTLLDQAMDAVAGVGRLAPGERLDALLTPPRA